MRTVAAEEEEEEGVEEEVEASNKGIVDGGGMCAPSFAFVVGVSANFAAGSCCCCFRPRASLRSAALEASREAGGGSMRGCFTFAAAAIFEPSKFAFLGSQFSPLGCGNDSLIKSAAEHSPAAAAAAGVLGSRAA